MAGAQSVWFQDVASRDPPPGGLRDGRSHVVSNGRCAITPPWAQGRPALRGARGKPSDRAHTRTRQQHTTDKANTTQPHARDPVAYDCSCGICMCSRLAQCAAPCAWQFFVFFVLGGASYGADFAFQEGSGPEEVMLLELDHVSSSGGTGSRSTHDLGDGCKRRRWSSACLRPDNE